jgi:hypothetical protein
MRKRMAKTLGSPKSAVGQEQILGIEGARPQPATGRRKARVGYGTVRARLLGA